MESLQTTLERRGWVVLTTASSAEFDTLALSLGTPQASQGGRPLFEQLRVVAAADAHPHSHSALHGMGAFPFHTDTAHWPVPARFVALRAAVRSSRPTFVMNLGDAIVPETFRLLEESLFTVVNGRHSFLAPAWDKARAFLRYDPTCMRAATRAGVRARASLERVVLATSPIRVAWGPGTTLIIDNWRCLHARGTSTEPDAGTRQLRRALLRGN